MSYDAWKLDSPPQLDDAHYERWLAAVDETMADDGYGPSADRDTDFLVDLFRDGVDPEAAARKLIARLTRD